VITGVHALIWSPRADAVRVFLRDVLGWNHVDAGGGWLIFAMPPAEVAVHPTEDEVPAHHELYLMCDDIEATLGELRAKGVETPGAIADVGWGRVAAIRLPDGNDLAIYQPAHATAIPSQPGASAADRVGA
jgi:predicted enzyme related to lactoylglutathione lyase